MKKRIIALMIALAFMLSSMQTVSFAAEAGEHIRLNVTSSATKLKAGDEFDVVIRVSGNNNLIGALSIAVNYDKDVIEHVAKPDNTYETALFTGNVLSVFNADVAGEFTAGITALDGVTLDGDIVKFRFKVKDTVSKFGNYEFTVTEKDYDIFANNETYTYTLKDENIACSTLTIVNPCTGITLDKDTLTIARGETATLTATVEPANTTNTIVWSSENDNIATVENGVVTAVGLGETTITAACGDKTASCKVTVTKATIAGTADIYTKEGFFYGATLGASPLITNDGWETAITTIKWYRDGEADSIATGDKYKIGEKDIGKQLYIIVTADKYTGELKSKLTDVIEKAPKNAPDKPIIEAKENVITVTNVNSNVEYRLGSEGEFGSTTSFTVEYGKSYYVEARYTETATHKASAIVTSNAVITPNAPCNLTVTAGEGGTVDGIPEDTVREGDEVTLTAKPGDFDHKFVKWEVTGITLTEEAAKATQIIFTMGSEDVTVKAVFEKKEAVIINFNVLNFTYDGTQKTPEIGPEEVVGMGRTIEYFDSLNNKLKSAPTEAGTYKVKVTFTSSEASEYRTTWADATFTIARAEQTAPAAPTPTNATSNSFELDIVAKQEYVISTTQATPAESEWKQGTELTSPVTGLKPATTYYVFTRVKGNNNYNPSPAVYATVTTAHTYAWEVEGSGVVGENVRVGGTLPESLTGTIKNIGTGTITNIKAALSGENVDNFKLDAVSTELASNGTLNIIVKPQGITTDNKGSYNVDVKVTADEVEYKIISFVISVVEKDPVIITGIDDKTVTFNGKTQGIDLSKANISGDAVDVSKLTVTYTKDGKTVAEPRDAGTYDVAISYEDTNYIGSTTAKLIINKKDITVKGFEAQSKVYDGKADAVVNSTNAKLDGMIEGTDVGFDKSGLTFKFDDKNVGTSKAVKNTAPITLTGTDAGNYNLTNPIVKLTADITRKPVTVTAAVAEKTYNGRTDDANVTMSAPELIAGDDVQFDKVTGTYVTADAGDNVEVTVTYTISGVDKDNYSYSIADKAYGKVNKADLNVTLTAPVAVTYDGKTHEVSSVTDDRVAADNGKTLYTLTYNNKDALPVDADTYEVTAKLTAEGSKNYNLKANTVDVVINKAGMSATNKEYTVAFMLAGAQSRKLSDLQLAPANVSGKWSVATGTNEILDGEAKIDGENLVFTVKSGLTTADIGKKVELTLTFTPDKNYNPVTATVTVTLAQDTYTNSIVGTLPTQVKLGDALDFTGVQLVTKFGSGAPDQTLDVNDSTKVEVTTTYDHTAKEIGVKTVTFTDKANSGITYTHTFTVVDVLEGVKLEANPTAYSYKLKEATSIGFDGKIHAVYKSGAKKALNHADVVLTMSDGTVVDSAKEARLLNTLGTATITITYTEKYLDGTSDKQSIDITVSVTAAPVKPDGKPNAEGFAVTPIPDAGKEMEYKDDAGNNVKPENVQGKLADAAPGTLEEEVKKNPAFNNVGNGDVVYENISFKDENGKPVTFANGKMQVTVPYPADSNKGDEFVMLIPDGEGKMKAIVPQKTADGLQFEIENSDVTFAIGWYTPAPSPVLPTEPERDPEDNFWNEVYWTLLRSGQGSVITANAGYYDRVPQGVLRAVDISGNTLIINSAFGMQVVVNPGALEKLGMYRIFYPISYLKEMLKGSSVISGSGTTGITVGVLMPTTGDATVVEHPYTMTPASAGFIKGMENTANARPVIDNADGVSVLDGAQRNDGAVIGGGMLIGLGLLALLGAAYVTMRKRGN